MIHLESYRKWCIARIKSVMYIMSKRFVKFIKNKSNKNSRA